MDNFYKANLAMTTHLKRQSTRQIELLKLLAKKKRAQRQRQRKIRDAKKQWLKDLAEEAEEEEGQEEVGKHGRS
eukprot:12922624-Prorocentrum_lima.AAC.1